MLVHLAYASRAAAPTTEALLQDILKHSKRHNLAAGITGLLCCADDVFIQCLEGARAEVNQLYARIVTDPRHRDVCLLSYFETAERDFSAWSMGLVDVKRLNPAQLLKHSATARLDPYRMPGRATVALMKELVATGSVSERG